MKLDVKKKNDLKKQKPENYAVCNSFPIYKNTSTPYKEIRMSLKQFEIIKTQCQDKKKKLKKCRGFG